MCLNSRRPILPSRFLLPVLAVAIYFVGATEFMLTAMLAPLAEAFATTSAQASWLVSSYALAYAMAAPAFGLLADRIDRRSLLLASLVLFALDGLAITLAPSFEIAIALRVLGGLASAALIPTAAALLADLVSEDRQAGAMGKVMLGMTLGIVSGPVFAGVLTDYLSWRAPFIVTAAGCLVTFCVARGIIPAQRPAGSARIGRFGWVGQGRIARPLIAKGLWNGTAVTSFLLAGEVLRQRHGLTPAMVGGAVAAFGTGLGLGNLLVGRVRRRCRGDEMTLLLAVTGVSVAISVFMFAPLSLIGGMICLLLWGAWLGMAAPASTALIARRSGGNKGQVLAVSESLNNVTVLTALPIMASLLAGWGPRGAGVIALALLVVAISLTVADTRRGI